MSLAGRASFLSSAPYLTDSEILKSHLFMPSSAVVSAYSLKNGRVLLRAKLQNP